MEERVFSAPWGPAVCSKRIDWGVARVRTRARAREWNPSFNIFPLKPTDPVEADTPSKAADLELADNEYLHTTPTGETVILQQGPRKPTGNLKNQRSPTHNQGHPRETPREGRRTTRDGTGGIRFERDALASPENRASTATDPDSPAQSPCSSVPPPCNLSQKRGQSDEVTASSDAFLQNKFTVPKPVLDVFEDIYGEYHRDSRLAVAHIMACQDQKTAIGIDEGHRTNNDFVPLPASLRNDVISQADMKKLRDDGVLGVKVVRVGGAFLHYKPGQCIEYRVPPSLLSKFMEARMKSLQWKTVYNLIRFASTFDTSKARLGSPPSTQFTDKTDHVSPKKDTTMRAVMKRMEHTRVDLEAVETFTQALSNELKPLQEEVRRRFEDFKDTLPTVDGDEELTDQQDRAYSLFKDAEKASRSRQETARHVTSNTAEQIVEWHGGGTATARVKLEQQEPWARLSHVGTFLQSGSRELKTCAFAGVEAYNCDLDSCFDRILRRLFQEADISCETLEGWLDSDTDWKQEVADDCGVSRGTVKAFAHRTKFAVRPPYPNPTNEKAAQAVLMDVGDGWEQAFEGLKERFAPVHEAVCKLHDYLTGPWVEKEAYPAGDGKYVKGRTGARLRVDDPPNDDLRKDLLTFRLFDEEQLFMQTLVQELHDRFDVATYSLEHDGIVTDEPVPDEAIRSTKKQTGLGYMKLDPQEPIREGYVLSQDEAEPKRLAAEEAEEQREKVRRLLDRIGRVAN
ncbi:hypothetical protein GGQ02_000149 [Salinibacter ruber]|uniref:hypothetical protein n=1 Tax=Salinibacter ruber TaxID=146919 RepID=UPI0021670A6B|nr:hypothetical protein [Salinibacter ruber]MCS4031790.1 hypothetical protein [Salinibacter ruber]